MGRVFGLYWNLPMGLARLLRGYDDNMVVFSSFLNTAYNDNPRYISEALYAARPETDIVWLFDDVNAARRQYQIPEYVRVCPANRLSGKIALARARVVVDNARKHFYLSFPGKGQCYIQTWHGDRGFKKMGYDDPGFNFLMLEEFASLGVVGSTFGEKLFQTAFHIRGELMTVGSPRNDILLRQDPAEREAVRARLGLDADTRVLMYAPTYRAEEVKEHKPHTVPLDLHRVLDTLERTTGAKWKCLMRAHYYTHGIAMDDSTGRLIPASDYPEMAELLLISDALLTDYSSCAGDYALMRRPIFLYQEDAESFSAMTRQFYFDMKDSHYWLAYSPEELDRLIETATPERVRENCDAVLRFYGEKETGHATESVVRYIVSKLK